MRLIINYKESCYVENDKRRADGLVRAVAQTLAVMGLMVQLGFSGRFRAIFSGRSRFNLDYRPDLRNQKQGMSQECSVFIYLNLVG